MSILPFFPLVGFPESGPLCPVSVILPPTSIYAWLLLWEFQRVVSQRLGTSLCVCKSVCVFNRHISVCVRITEESMAILTKPYAKIRAWLYTCVSLLIRLIALMYVLLIA